jgi:hypothetical protein
MARKKADATVVVVKTVLHNAGIRWYRKEGIVNRR